MPTSRHSEGGVILASRSEGQTIGINICTRIGNA